MIPEIQILNIFDFILLLDAGNIFLVNQKFW